MHITTESHRDSISIDDGIIPFGRGAGVECDEAHSDTAAKRTRFSQGLGIKWVSSIVSNTEDKTVCIDGKRIRTASWMSSSTRTTA